MKILHVTNAHIGGAWVAAHRLHVALRSAGIDSRMLVRTKGSVDPFVSGVGTGEVRFADFTCQGEQGSKSHQKHEKSQKKRGARERAEESLDRINGIEGIGGDVHHETHEKGRGEARAQNPVTRTTLYNAVNRWNFARKKKAWRNLKVSFIAPSTWMAEQVKKSPLFCKSPVTVIPNCLDLEVFKPMDQMQCRKKLGLPLGKKLILFGAFDPLEPNKGLDLLEEALHKLPEEVRGGMGVVVFGCKGEWKIGGLETVWLGAVPGEKAMAEVYNAADLTCVPSRKESFGYTAAESLACGVPVVGFRTSGLTDIVEHQMTGWLAESFCTDDFCRGLVWILDKKQGTEAGGQKAACRRKAEKMFSFEMVVKYYESVYSLVQD